MKNAAGRERPRNGAGRDRQAQAGRVHLTFVALKYALDQGKTVEGILKFEKAGTDEVEFPVAAFGPAAPALRRCGAGRSDLHLTIS